MGNPLREYSHDSLEQEGCVSISRSGALQRGQRTVRFHHSACARASSLSLTEVSNETSWHSGGIPSVPLEPMKTW
jgi:hypothetical protein